MAVLHIFTSLRHSLKNLFKSSDLLWNFHSWFKQINQFSQPQMDESVRLSKWVDIYNLRRYIQAGTNCCRLAGGLRGPTEFLRTKRSARVFSVGLRLSSFLSPRSSILGPQSSVLSPRSSLLSLQSSILDPQSSFLPVLNPQSSIRNPQSSVLGPWSSIFSPQSSVLNPQSLVLREASLITTYLWGYTDVWC